MPITAIYSFLVHPSKNEEDPPQIGGTSIRLNGRLYEMLRGVYERASDECKIEIVFTPNEDGDQINPCRDELLAYLFRPDEDNGRTIATRLQEVTTNRSGLGLLFLLAGEHEGLHHLVIARFPADQGIVAEEHAETLSVEFLERVFMKNARAYKSALYQTTSAATGFWDGRAVDRQISGPRELSQYWISEFLLSDLRTTGAAGTKRLAAALRTAVNRVVDPTVKAELLSAVQLLRGHDGRRISAIAYARRLGLSDAATGALRSAFSRPDLMEEFFAFDLEEFEKEAPYKLVELDNGAILMGDTYRFDEIFEREQLRVAENKVRYATEGHVVDERLRKSR